MSGRGFGRGRGGRRQGIGGPAYCVCPNCGHRIPYTRGVPCRSIKCPKCGMFMMSSS